MPPRFILRRLVFTGPGKDICNITFAEGLNVVWGASNTGKSFIVKALDYMFGSGSTLPGINQRRGFDNCWLELDLPTRGRVTLRRGLAGGGFDLHATGFETAVDGGPSEQLGAKHAAEGSLSGLLLSELGVVGKKIAKNQDGEKDPFTFRHFATYVLTEETPMLAEASPIKIAAQSAETFDKNVLKFLLTGIDGSAVVTTKSRDDQKAANSGKIELVDEMLATAERELAESYPDGVEVSLDELYTQQSQLAETIKEHQAVLSEVQFTLDRLRRERRDAVEVQEVQKGRADEIGMTLGRFALLAQVYDSDVSRLLSLEEGAAALLAGSKRPCPLCGADPKHQHEMHGLEQVERSQRAVRAEIAKIRTERADLMKAQASLNAEKTGLAAVALRTSDLITALSRQIEETKPKEATGRQAYEQLDEARQRLHYRISLANRVTGLKARRETLAAFKPPTRKRGAITVGVDGPTGHKLATVVQGILRAWRFPGDPAVSFDGKTHDILLDGNDRRSNGKGVRALMNSAFKIGVLMYCRAENLPHPGIVVLDSPLVSYRDPHTSKHGELSAAEQTLSQTGLKDHFYRHLLGLSRDAQILVVENDAPSVDLGPATAITAFTGASSSTGRRGLF
jgi:hypothetical protein